MICSWESHVLSLHNSRRDVRFRIAPPDADKTANFYERNAPFGCPCSDRAGFQAKEGCRLRDGKQIVLSHGGPRGRCHVSRSHERRGMLRCRLCGSALTCPVSRSADRDAPRGRDASTECQAHKFPGPAARSKSLPCSWFNLRGALWRFCSLHEMRFVLYLT